MTVNEKNDQLDPNHILIRLGEIGITSLILEGGYNEEHDVSLNTSKEIQKILDKVKIKYRLLFYTFYCSNW